MPKTLKSVALGSAIRQARLDQHVTLRDFAARLSFDPAMLSRWENGERYPKPERVAQILTALGVNGARYKEIMTLAYGTDTDQWVAATLPEQRQQMAAFLSYEENAERILEVSPLLIPGLLQTTEYTRAVMVGEGVPPDEVEARVAIRVRRKQVMLRPRPAHFVALIGQAALYQAVGGRDAALAQLRYLLMVGRRENVELRIVPLGQGWHPALEGAFQLMAGANLITNVFVDTRRSTLWLHKEADVSAFRQAADKVLRIAVSQDDSMRFIADLVQRMEMRGDLPDQVAQVDP